MLGFLRRHHQTFWIVVTIVVIVSFVFWGSFSKTGTRAGQIAADDTAFTIYGRDYTYTERDRFARAGELAVRYLALYDFFRDLSSLSVRYSVPREQVPLEFVLNLLVLRHELEKNGIHASDAEVREEFKALPALQNNGAFDASRGEMLERMVGALGMRTDDVYDLLRDVIGLRKLRQVISGNYVPSPQLTSIYYAATYQTVKAGMVTFALEDFKKAATVTEEEIGKYYEQKKDEYKTTEKRAATYAFFPKPKGLEKASDEERRKENNKYAEAVRKFSTTAARPGADFAAAGKESGVELKTLASFAMSELPEALKSEDRLAADIFQMDMARPVSEPLEGKEGYWIFHLDSIDAPKQQDIKDVTSQIKETLVTQKAQEAMMKAASDARKALEAATKEGKSFEDAAKGLKLQTKPIPEFSADAPLKDLPNGQEIAREAEKIPAGGYVRPLPTDSGVAVVHVEKKELRKKEDSGKLKDNISTALLRMTQDPVFKAWFDRVKQDGKIDAGPVLRSGNSYRVAS